jgi:hypothetical protein
MTQSLSKLQLIIYARIKETRHKMDKAHFRSDTDRLWIQIETLQWALAQICRLMQTLFTVTNFLLLTLHQSKDILEKRL